MSDIPEADWSALPGEILDVIAHRFLIKLKDFIRLQAVCKHWKRALVNEHQKPRFRQSIPWLMLSYCRSRGNMITSSAAAMAGCKRTDRCRCFYDVTEQRFLHIEVELPEGFIINGSSKTTRAACCRGSSFGWVLLLQRAPSLLLLNPLTGDKIWLPPITAFPDMVWFDPERVGYEYRYVNLFGQKVAQGKKSVEERYIAKLVLSADPTTATASGEELVVMVIRSPEQRSLAFCRPTSAMASDQGWTLVPHDGNDYGLDFPKPIIYFVDVVFWRGRFYALNSTGNVYVCDISPHQRPKLSLFLNPCPRILADKHYLLSSPDGGELMMVTRNVTVPQWIHDTAHRNTQPLSLAQQNDGVHHFLRDSAKYDDDDVDAAAATSKARVLTTEFKVYKLNEDAMGWEEQESIGDFALFLGFNTANFVSAKDHPELGLAPNSIYYTDDVTNYHFKDSYRGSDMGIYNLATRTIQPLYCTGSLRDDLSLIYPLPVWILPSI